MFNKSLQHKVKTASAYPALGLAVALLFVSSSSNASEECPLMSDEVEVIEYAAPDLPEVSVEANNQKAQKSNTNFFSWLTKTHTMPNLHFIEFIELFGDDTE